MNNTDRGEGSARNLQEKEDSMLIPAPYRDVVRVVLLLLEILLQQRRRPS